MDYITAGEEEGIEEREKEGELEWKTQYICRSCKSLFTRNKFQSISPEYF